jgi:hypothetical protein
VFRSSHPFLFCDYFRIPYEVVPDGDGRLEGASGEVRWPVLGRLRPPERLALGETSIFCSASEDEDAHIRLGPRWEPDLPLRTVDGEVVAHVWRDGSGGVFLPFDPAEAITACWSEAYQQSGGSRLALRAYYRLRPLLPRGVQIRMRRAFTRIQARRPFPRWPVETALHDLYAFLFAELRAVAGEPVPYVAPWPAGHTWAVVLTHDVEQEVGYRNIHLLRDAEKRAGLRSSWNLVPKRYDVDDETVAALERDGFEVGVHGLYHDGRDLESERTLRERLPEIRRWAERWRASGFRSPATHRDWALMPLLGFDYDSSYPDTDPFEPQSGGCCSVLPYFNDELVELPITLPQDHTLFVILGRGDERVWIEKADAVRALGGMALLDTHPDYMLSPERVELYERFLAHVRGDETAWHALPRDVSAWWRRRAASHVERDGDGWRVVGPAAAEAAVAFAS